MPPTGAASGTATSATADGRSPAAPTSPGVSRENVRVAANSAVGANDSLLLGALVLGFTFAVSGVVVAAGLRGGRRVH